MELPEIIISSGPARMILYTKKNKNKKFHGQEVLQLLVFE